MITKTWAEILREDVWPCYRAEWFQRDIWPELDEEDQRYLEMLDDLNGIKRD